MLSASHLKIRQPRIIGVSPATHTPATGGRKLRNTRARRALAAATPQAPLTWEKRPRTLRSAPEPDPQKQQKCMASIRSDESPNVATSRNSRARV